MYYVLIHSHCDIGYTDIQPHIAAKQAHNVIHALELIEQTKDYPPGAQFKWNTEGFWQVEQFYKIATAEQKADFEQAVREHRIYVDAMYGNLLTGLARGEELLGQLKFSTELEQRCGVKCESMMISDVPGLIWGIVPSLAQAGVKYISDGPNASSGMVGDRIGYVRVPLGKSSVLVGFALGQGARDLLGRARRLFHRPPLRLDPRCHRRTDDRNSRNGAILMTSCNCAGPRATTAGRMKA